MKEKYNDDVAENMFQFQDGSIKCIGVTHVTPVMKSFNSKMVRLNE